MKLLKPTRRLFLAGGAALIAAPAIVRAGSLSLLGVGKPAAGGAFTPANISGLIGWYKADAGAYVDAGSTLATNGQTVQQWNDQSGTGNHLTQATALRRPTFTTGLLNALPGIVFNRANTQWIANQAISLGGTTASAFIVAKTPAAGSASDRFVSFTNTSSADDFGNSSSAIFLYSASDTSISSYRVGALSNGTVVVSTSMQMGTIYDGTNNTVYLGGVAKTPVANTMTFGATGSLNVGDFVASPPGSTTSGGSALSGTIHEIVFTNTAIGSSDRSSLNSYFTGRWGV